MVSCASVMLQVDLLHIVCILYEPSSPWMMSVKSPASMYPEGLWLYTTCPLQCPGARAKVRSRTPYSVRSPFSPFRMSAHSLGICAQQYPRLKDLKMHTGGAHESQDQHGNSVSTC